MLRIVFDAHDRAFTLFKGTCRRGIYDNMKTAVNAAFGAPVAFAIFVNSASSICTSPVRRCCLFMSAHANV
jgi:hypothetical protein